MSPKKGCWSPNTLHLRARPYLEIRVFTEVIELKWGNYGEPSDKAMASYSSTLAWKIPWMEEPGRLQSMDAKSQAWLSDFPFTFHFHALEKEMATHSSVLAWRIPGTGEPGGLPSLGLHRVGHDWSDLAVTNMTDVLKNGEIWTQNRRAQWGALWKDAGRRQPQWEDWRERWRWSANRWSRSHRMDSLPGSPGGSRADNTLISDFQPKNCKAINFCYFKPPRLCYFVTSSCIQAKCFHILSAMNNWNFKLKSLN